MVKFVIRQVMVVSVYNRQWYECSFFFNVWAVHYCFLWGPQRRGVFRDPITLAMATFMPNVTGTVHTVGGYGSPSEVRDQHLLWCLWRRFWTTQRFSHQSHLPEPWGAGWLWGESQLGGSIIFPLSWMLSKGKSFHWGWTPFLSKASFLLFFHWWEGSYWFNFASFFCWTRWCFFFPYRLLWTQPQFTPTKISRLIPSRKKVLLSIIWAGKHKYDNEIKKDFCIFLCFSVVLGTVNEVALTCLGLLIWE